LPGLVLQRRRQVGPGAVQGGKQPGRAK
jgi:hypothetical protein